MTRDRAVSAHCTSCLLQYQSERIEHANSSMLGVSLYGCAYAKNLWADISTGSSLRAEPGDIFPGMCNMPATFSRTSRCLWLPETCEAALAMESSSVQSSCTMSSLPLLLPCSCCSSAAPSGLRQVATTLQDGLHILSKRLKWYLQCDRL